MKVAFYVSRKAGRLRYYLSQDANAINDLCLVISDETNSELAIELSKKGIPYLEFDYKKEIERKNENLRLSDFLLAKFLEYKIDFVYSHGGHILSGAILAKFENRIVNFHPSLLPMHPGLRAIDKAMDDDSTILIGNSAHFINEKVDAGMLIAQNIFTKSHLIKFGYEYFLNSQIDLLELIHKNIKHGGLFVNENTVYLKHYTEEDVKRVYFNYE